jgi:hypothetical protein
MAKWAVLNIYHPKSWKYKLTKTVVITPETALIKLNHLKTIVTEETQTLLASSMIEMLSLSYMGMTKIGLIIHLSHTTYTSKISKGLCRIITRSNS